MKHVILGNGPTGVVAAETLRNAAPKDEIVMIGCEAEPPYSRMAIPYLLEGNIDERGTYLRKTDSHFDNLGVRQKNGKATALDVQAKRITFADGSTEAYDRLLIATGSHPVRPPIPGVELPQVQTCWTLEDARAIAKLAAPGARVLQLGAGFIGCIIMEALAKRGVKLTVVEMGDRMVPRMMTPKAGGMIKRWVEEKGIRVVTGASVQRIDPAGANNAGGIGAAIKSMVQSITGGGADQSSDAVTVTLSTGEKIECDLVIAAAGVRPNVEFLKGTGITIGNGVSVDASMRTSVADVFAAGDVAEGPDFFTGEGMVSAIQPNAADQGRIAALGMAGRSVELPGVLAINVLDTLSLISVSFGQWWGETPENGGTGVELVDEGLWRYLSLQFQGDVLIGATAIGRTDQVGVLRGLIQNRTALGPWKDVLMDNPTRFVDAYIATSQPVSIAA